MGYAVWLVALSVGVGCGAPPPPPFTGPDGSRDGATDASADGDLDGDACSARARFIYVVDDEDGFFRFDPPSGAFTRIGAGPLACPGASHDGGTAHPFSMAIDQDAIAWVLYADGALYRVSTLDGTCQATAYVPGQMGFTLFGMGFSSNAPLPDRMGETLFVARGVDADDAIATLDTETLSISPLGPIAGTPELTGNGNAELWGFFPDETTPTVRRLDKTTGAPLTTYDLTAGVPDVLATGVPSAWAFAFWGGRYFVFFATEDQPTTRVNALAPGGDSDAWSFTRIVDDAGRRIVGAGVSTCAPVVIE